MTDLSKLRELAENATPGPWVEESHTNAVISPEAEFADGTPAAVAETVYMSEDRAYLVAVSPDKILALLDRMEAAERGRGQALNLVRIKAKANARWRRLLRKELRESQKRAEAAEAKIAAVEALHVKITRYGNDYYSIAQSDYEDDPSSYEDMEPFDLCAECYEVEKLICEECGGDCAIGHRSSWPCPTARALQESEGE